MTRFGHVYTPGKTKEAERLIRELAYQHMPDEPISGPIQMDVTFWIRRSKAKKNELRPTKRPDLDNLLKLLLDALNPVIDKKTKRVVWQGPWNDDSQIVDIHAMKMYDPCGVASIEVKITELP